MLRGNPTRSLIKLPAGTPLVVQVASQLEAVVNLFQRHGDAVVPTLLGEGDTAQHRNSLLHHQDKGVAVACPRPPGRPDSQAISLRREDVDAGLAEAYADIAAVDHEEQPEGLPQEAHACVSSQARNAPSAESPTR